METFAIVAASVSVTVVIVYLLLNWSSGEKKIKYQIASSYGIADPQFTRSISQLLGPPIVDGNHTVALKNGDEIFPAMLAAIRAARMSVTFKTFIYWSGQIGHAFADALAERARAGVKVHVLVDWVGSSKMDAGIMRTMEDAKVEIEKYRPPRWYTLSRMNHRTHRKLLVVDGKVGFTGGVGIADPWLGDAHAPTRWRDSHFRIEGPAVAQMQAAFMDNWLKTRSEVLHGDKYFPALETGGSMSAQVFKSSDREGSESVRLLYLMSIACARKTIRIANAYFIPDDLSITSLVEARQRGVRIEIIVPGPLFDSQVARRAGRSRWGRLLEAGVEMYEYQPAMYHCKVLIVDDAWVSVGSTNFDDRSFRLNDEANLNILDQDFASRLARDFEQDRTQSRQVSLAEWTRRPWSEKLAEHALGLLRSQM